MAKPSRKQRKQIKARQRKQRSGLARAGEAPSAEIDHEADDDDEREDEPEDEPAESGRRGPAGEPKVEPPPWRRPKKKDAANRRQQGDRVVVGFFLAFVIVAIALIYWQSRPDPPKGAAPDGSSTPAPPIAPKAP